jgi:hypothetical protein
MDSSKSVLELVGKKYTSGLTKADQIQAINCMLKELAESLRYTTGAEFGNESLRYHLYTDGRHSLKRLREELEASSRISIHEKKIMSQRGYFSRHFTPEHGLFGKKFVSVKFGFDRNGKWHAYKIMLRLTTESLTGATEPVSVTEEKGDILMMLTDPNGEYAALGIKLDHFRSLVVDTAESLRVRTEESHRRAAQTESEVRKLDFLVRYLIE